MIGTLDRSLHEGLTRVAGERLDGYVSAGLEAGVVPVLQRFERAHRFLTNTLGIEPQAALLFLSPEDWPARTAHPLYGMPNYRDGNLVLSGAPNPFWTELLDLIRDKTPDATDDLARAYATPAGEIDLQPFFDLLAVHELAHIFMEAGGRSSRRLWLGEFACNLFLHAYVATNEPDLLPVLETFPSAYAALPASRFTHRTLDEFETAYAHGMDGANYGWFQCQFHRAAAAAYEESGMDGVTGLWKVLESPGDDVIAAIEAGVSAAAARRFRQWPNG